MEMASLPQGGTPVPAQRVDATQSARDYRQYADDYMRSMMGRLTPYVTPNVPRPEGLPRLSLSEEARTAQSQGPVRVGTLGQPGTRRALEFDMASPLPTARTAEKQQQDEQKELDELYKQQGIHKQFEDDYEAFKASVEGLSLVALNRSIDEFKKRAMSELRQLEAINFSKKDIQTEQERIGEQYEEKNKELNISSFIASNKKASLDVLDDITPDNIKEWIKTEEGISRKLKIMEDDYRADENLQGLDMETKKQTIENMLKFDRSIIDKKRAELGLDASQPSEGSKAADRSPEGSSSGDDALLQRLSEKYNSLQREVVEKLDPMEVNPDERPEYLKELGRLWNEVRDATREVEEEYKNIKSDDGKSKFAELHNSYFNFQVYLKTRVKQYHVINIMENRIKQLTFDEVEHLLDNPEDFNKEVDALIKTIRDKVKIKDEEFKDSYEQQLPLEYRALVKDRYDTAVRTPSQSV
jgi:hypothetical protein